MNYQHLKEALVSMSVRSSKNQYTGISTILLDQIFICRRSHASSNRWFWLQPLQTVRHWLADSCLLLMTSISATSLRKRRGRETCRAEGVQGPTDRHDWWTSNYWAKTASFCLSFVLNHETRISSEWMVFEHYFSNWVSGLWTLSVS